MGETWPGVHLPLGLVLCVPRCQSSVLFYYMYASAEGLHTMALSGTLLESIYK